MKKNANSKFRLYCTGSGVPLWKVAEAEGIAESTLYRRLRIPLSDEEEARLRAIVDRIRKEDYGDES